MGWDIAIDSKNYNWINAISILSFAQNMKSEEISIMMKQLHFIKKILPQHAYCGIFTVWDLTLINLYDWAIGLLTFYKFDKLLGSINEWEISIIISLEKESGWLWIRLRCAWTRRFLQGQQNSISKSARTRRMRRRFIRRINHITWIYSPLYKSSIVFPTR